MAIIVACRGVPHETCETYQRLLIVEGPRWKPSRFCRRLEAAQVVLGHRHAAITETYAERDMALAAEIMRKIG